MGDGLRAAIDGLYKAFAAYPRPPWFKGCSCCWAGDPLPPEHQRQGDWSVTRGSVVVQSPGGTRPLRSISANELAEFAASVPLTGGTVDLLKHYLPRLLEIAVGEGFDYTDMEIVFDRLSYDTPWTHWPEPEQRALREFFRALWIERLATGPDPDDYEVLVDDVLCAIGLADPDIGWYLDTWLGFDKPNAGRNLLRFLVLNLRHLADERELWNAYWDNDDGPGPDNCRRVLEWLGAEATTTAIDAAIERARTAEERDVLGECRRLLKTGGEGLPR